MFLLGIDIGTSSVKVSVTDAASGQCLASAQFPEAETGILSLQPGWAEQSPDQWWENVKQAILKCHASGKYRPADIAAIGIAYQMHGLVLVDKEQHVLRNAIIWCDSRAVDTGNKAFEEIGAGYCLSHLLNSPGNFTASKLAWVKQHEPGIYEKIHKIMLPGDFIAMKFTGDITTTVSALSEGIFWDFTSHEISKALLSYFGFDPSLFPPVKDVFGPHGQLKETVATRLSLKPGIPVSYKAGDQFNNAISLNVYHPGEVAATAGTSGVIYAVTEELIADSQSRINSFAHVNHSATDARTGILLCINGCGITNKWARDLTGSHYSYRQMNEAAAMVEAGCNGMQVIPFGNGAERMLHNRTVGAHVLRVDYNVHTAAHLFRAVQEGIAFAFRYGMDIMHENDIFPSVVRAGKANLFLSDVFAESFANATGLPVELYNTDGSRGAAGGAGIGAGIYKDHRDIFSAIRPVRTVEPGKMNIYAPLYESWKETLLNTINKQRELWES